ncbi:SGNH/GDSL hydrolase family protein [Mycobacteroides franklinii]|uniref:SGNH/GDSL hydrolase family protein n=1 Tax=Mycobacteroides franklinii TaxID=948102 RepID=A0A4R5PE75_9MYCO|nr:SGNH/GDSL hydrolase family protein [Mycobacteroides franklinii]
MEVAVVRLAAFIIAFGFLIGFPIGRAAEHPQPVRPYRLAYSGSGLNHVAVVSDSYTTGTREGGLGAKSWTSLAWRILGREGVSVSADVAAEGRAGYGVRGDHGSVFADLTGRVVHPDDELVVFFGSRNDQGVDPDAYAEATRSTLESARRMAPAAKLLVIGPPWPTADVPDVVTQLRDILYGQARAVGAAWVDPLAERWFVGRPELIGSDGVHPNDAGHAYLADKIAPLIGTRLTRRL